MRAIILLTFTFAVSAFLFPTTQGVKRAETLDKDGRYHVAWEVISENKTIIFEVTAQTTGYVGFGISPKGGMTGADIVIGGVSADGQPYFEDRYAEENGFPPVDDHSDWTLISASENDTSTFLKFSRLLSTCDGQDVEITGDTQRFIWALGATDTISYHNSDRSSYAVNMLDPPYPEVDLSNYDRFNVTIQLTMPDADTAYWISMHKGPEFTQKQHAVAFSAKLFGPDSEKHTHHFAMYKCSGPTSPEEEEAFNTFVASGGQDSLSSEFTPFNPWFYCSSIIYSWSIGGRVMHMPEGVGFPLSEEGGSQYYLLETHLDNPQKLSNVKFETGLEVYHTSELRPIEAGILTVGQKYQWNQVIPPSSTNYTVSGHCSSTCTSLMEPEGYDIFNVMLHSHTSGRQMKLRHFRNGTELPWIANDENYDNNYQDNRFIPAVKLLPGDHMTLECVYDNTWVNPAGAVIGGFSTREEMCETVMYYYPKGGMEHCRSITDSKKVLDMVGIQEVSEVLYSTNPMIVAPEELNGTRFLTYLDNTVNWTEALRSEFEKEMTIGKHFSRCFINGELLDIRDTPHVTYPQIDEEYTRVDECLEI